MNDHTTIDSRQSGAIPWRIGARGLEVLLITSSVGDRWIVPKGWIEPGLAPEESASKKAWEEAGVEGVLSEVPAGDLRFKRGARMITVSIYLLEVTKVHERWPEDFQRQRVWLPLPVAASTAGDLGLGALIVGLEEQFVPALQVSN